MKKITDKEIAEYYGITNRTMSNYKNGNKYEKRRYRALREFYIMDCVGEESLTRIIKDFAEKINNLKGEQVRQAKIKHTTNKKDKIKKDFTKNRVEIKKQKMQSSPSDILSKDINLMEYYIEEKIDNT